MSNSDALELVGYLISAFALGYGIGFYFMSFIKGLDKI